MATNPERFYKYHGLGNDFIVLEARPDLNLHDFVPLCDRRTGIGADGILLISERNGMPYMRVINSDGSAPEMCGNGIRCVAMHLHQTSDSSENTLLIDTDAGVHRCSVAMKTPSRADVEVQMQHPVFAAHDISASMDQQLIETPITIDGHAVRLTALSMGNPHAVTFDSFSESERLAIAPKIQSHAMFSHGINVSFATMISDRTLGLHVFERGAGWTEACGTGACAAAAAAVATGRMPPSTYIQVELAGGPLQIYIDALDKPILMRGEAVFVFEGILP